MKYALKFKSESPISFPVNYNKILQAAILSWLGNDEAAVFLHDKGYETNKRKYKLYTFSDIRGQYQYNKAAHRIEFTDEIYIILSFYSDEYESLIMKNVRDQRPMIFGTNVVEFSECMQAIEKYQPCIVDTVSPITVHSTFSKTDGSKRTYYYEPTENDFSEMIRQNLIRKYISYHETEPENTEFVIKPYNREKLRRIETRYNGTIIRAWRGSYQIAGSQELIKMALLSGIGDRNGTGFGCVLQRK